MTPPVEDIRGYIAEIIDVWPIKDGDTILYGDRVEKICTLISIVLEGLKKREKHCSAGILCDQDQCCDGYGFVEYNEAVQDLNSTISTIQKQLKEELK